MITIIGAGALGSHVALFLRNLKGKIRVIDFDRVDAHNVQAQFHTVQGLRKNKALALSQSMKGMFGAEVESIPHRLTQDNWSKLLMDATLLIDCTDNIAARRLIQEYYDEYGVPVLHGCLSADGQFARIVWDEMFVPDPEGNDGQATCEDGEALPFFAMASALIAVEVQNFLKTGKKRSFQLTGSGTLRIG